MEVNSYSLSIAELGTILDVVKVRLNHLREESGEDDFIVRLDKAIEELNTLIEDRCENEDTATLWRILYELRALLSRIMNKLSGLGEE